ncbi:hypothetical protein [Nocardiopsis dassonvillei]|uniref:Uncharacterized protein n=1 Tax=Nocardiopsis dassonvillei (strain ATCC 23218 / DSM 43111 / CIP 107115 / JCM 7437 / KCTC 9190 / NBRC 14626 / NCTC 10488 / NRRL B-5397 / IMRU 509) TaxID=446468 RepID=D7AXM7_NOCDD|nr:hypothetical protein [Nocardiopsis dassonvillei]ADH67931.1 hypothetical protein Ndas_2512 [Nocardiopsis dassonvillei subsp. dassonvillei DSM 43111]NKY79314.1 hypothetical protein [Nocardiopsis dassonvillei]VEI88433.1 Uncharacterised protein [Nocardiopsis dassonvillei]
MSAHTPPRAAREPRSPASGPPERPGRAERAPRREAPGRAGRPKPPWHTDRPDRRETGDRAQAPGGHDTGVAPELAEEYARIGAASEEELAADLLALTATHEGRGRDLLLSWAATALRFGERMADEDAASAGASGDPGAAGPAGVARTGGSTGAKGGSEGPQGTSCSSGASEVPSGSGASDTREVPSGSGAPGATGSSGAVSAPSRTGPSDLRVEERASGGLRPGEVLLAEYLHRASGDRVVVYADALDHAHRVARDAGWGRDLTPEALRETALAHEHAHRMLHDGRGRALRRELDHVLVRLGPLRLRGHVVGADEIAAHAYARRRAGLRRSPIALTAAIAATLAHRGTGHDRPAPRTSPGERP